MKTLLYLVSVCAMIGLAASLAFGNPSMLPKHPGYPAGNAIDPVKGQSLANDPGQPNATGTKALEEAAMANDVHVSQHLADPNNQRILEKEGAGVLPKVQGPQIKIEPPVSEATRMPK